MPGRLHRLSRAEFDVVARRGRRHTGPHFSLTTLPSPKGYAVVVPKRVARLATSRHRIKRRVLGTLAELRPVGGVIVFALAGAGTLPRAALQVELSSLIKKITLH